MSQQSLAVMLGLAFTQVQKYELGTNRVSASRLYEIAIALKVPILFFFEGLEDTSRACEEDEGERAARKFLQTAEGAELAQAFRRVISRRLRRQLVELVRSIADEEQVCKAENDSAPSDAPKLEM